MLSDGEKVWLERINNNGGTWPDRPFLRDMENAIPLMRKGLVALEKPKSPYLPFAYITEAGRRALQEDG